MGTIQCYTARLLGKKRPVIERVLTKEKRHELLSEPGN